MASDYPFTILKQILAYTMTTINIEIKKTYLLIVVERQLNSILAVTIGTRSLTK